MHSQLAGLGAIVRMLDPELAAFLDAKDAANFFFCYRWLLIHFKREFAFEEVRFSPRPGCQCVIDKWRDAVPPSGCTGQ